ncbi:DUF2711 family protein [Priestia megaterium]|uniref:DUF2711 family protein n=1 Tax=Priestia megaterium TaxID=1404 RepID=UPI0020D26598|nr:DUF2711 family protein [Priestia megaterium]
MYVTKYIQRRCLVLLDYIWIDGDLPILSQLPNDFNSAAILFHPFIQMPFGWDKSKRENPYQHIYPSLISIYILVMRKCLNLENQYHGKK